MPSAILWLLDGSLVPEADVVFFARQLGASEAQRYTRFQRQERKRQFLLGRILLRFAVSNLRSLPPSALDVIERPGKAPQFLHSDSQNFRLGFSLSHSRQWVACVVGSNVSLGMDIEVNDPARDILGISQAVFHPNEHRWLLSQVDSARVSAFYQLWSTREALYKLMSPLGHETVVSSLVGFNGSIATQGPKWHRYTLPHSALMLAICSDRPLSSLCKIELPRMARIDWLTAERVETWPQTGFKNEPTRPSVVFVHRRSLIEE